MERKMKAWFELPVQIFYAQIVQFIWYIEPTQRYWKQASKQARIEQAQFSTF